MAPLKVYIASVTANPEVRKHVQRTLMLLDGQGIPFDPIDICKPGNEEQRRFMQENATNATNPKQNPLPPQFFYNEEYLGNYYDFDSSVEDNRMIEFLRLEPNSEVVIEDEEEQDQEGNSEADGEEDEADEAEEETSEKAEAQAEDEEEAGDEEEGEDEAEDEEWEDEGEDEEEAEDEQEKEEVKKSENGVKADDKKDNGSALKPEETSADVEESAVISLGSSKKKEEEAKDEEEEIEDEEYEDEDEEWDEEDEEEAE